MEETEALDPYAVWTNGYEFSGNDRAVLKAVISVRSYTCCDAIVKRTCNLP